jgi:hypothetical protein
VGAEFNKPWFFGGTEFSITRDQTTTPAVECAMINAAVTVRYGRGLQDVWNQETALTTITVGGQSLVFPYGETRVGYFAVTEEVEMTALFSGEVDGSQAQMSKTMTIKPGGWHQVRFRLETDGDNSAGQIGDGEDW